jgi:hypothetical protein
LPIAPELSANVPPFWIVSIPVPFTPTDRFLAAAPGLATTVEFGVTVLMFASVVCVGRERTLQLTPKNQSEETNPVQSLVWACAETADAMKNAIAASNLAETNLPPACAVDAATRGAPINGSGSHSMARSQSIGNANN